tara:strand:+ start:1896 stop:2444 length:549 start_codon:yes stop_codon:yes gene_type:complete
MKDITTIILTSSLIAGVISSLISFFISVTLRKMDFRNDYYKEILKKRLYAYQFIENQIVVMKAVVLGDDGKPYHMIFSQGEEKLLEFQKDMGLAITYSLWIDDKTSNSLDELNNLFFNINNQVYGKSEDDVIKIGQKYYQKVADFRISLENDIKNGLYDLHDIKKIFKRKTKSSKRIIYKEN